MSKLGFIIDDGKSRWLTNKEISDGIIKAIKDDKPVTIVGTIHPR